MNQIIMNDNQIIVKDETILAFYRENPSLDFITMNHIFIDILKKLSTNLSETIHTTTNTKILSLLHDLTNDLSIVKNDFSKLNTDIINNISMKIHESKKDYIEDVKLVLNNNNLSNSEKLNSLLERNNDILLTKTNLIINEIIPKNQEKYYSQIESCVKNMSASLVNETNRLFENINKDESSIKHYFDNIDTQFNKMVMNIQQPIFTFIQSSEERTSSNIQQMKEKLTLQQNTQENLNNELNQFLNKYKYNSSLKGSISESELYSVLQQIFPSDEIIECTSETATCDYKVNRLNKDKPTILFENKDYTRSVSTDEILKFERDIKLQQHHGIFISQNSSITYKENFQIDIIDGLIHVYIPNAKYNQEKIKVAVDIIDSLSPKLNIIQFSQKSTSININSDDIDDLLEDYIEFNKQKTQLVDNVKNSSKQILDKIEEMQYVSIKKILLKNGFLQNDDDFKCKFCNNFSGKNKASLGAHIRTCKMNPKNNTSS